VTVDDLAARRRAAFDVVDPGERGLCAVSFERA